MKTLRKLLPSNTLEGVYQYIRLLFVIVSSHTIFQGNMESILQGIDGIAYYIDGIFVTSKTDQKHLEKNKKVFQCRLHAVHVNLAKCQLFSTVLTSLGIGWMLTKIKPQKTRCLQLSMNKAPYAATFHTWVWLFKPWQQVHPVLQVYLKSPCFWCM